MMMETIDRRLFDRFPARFPSKFRDTSLDFGMDVFLKDVSATGLRLTTRQKMFLDDVVSVEVQMPDGLDPVVLNGRVRWIHQVMTELWEIGVEFHRVDFMRMHRLVRYAFSLPQD